MQVTRVLLVLLFSALVGCKILPTADDQTRPGFESEPAAQLAVEGAQTMIPNSGIRPRPRPAPVAEPAAAPGEVAAEPLVSEAEVEITKEQIKCEKQGGKWGKAGRSNGKACVKPVRDGGKQCRKESDCDSVCLARSRTCAPVKPLFGCNEILQDDGRRVTLCID